MAPRQALPNGICTPDIPGPMPPEVAELGAEALAVLPPVAAFEAGFPSMRERAEQIAHLRAGFPELRLPLPGLLTKAEGRLPATWPAGLDAV